MSQEKIENIDIELHTECAECGRVRHKLIQLNVEDFDNLCDQYPDDNYVDSEGISHRHVYDVCVACDHA